VRKWTLHTVENMAAPLSHVNKVESFQFVADLVPAIRSVCPPVAHRCVTGEHKDAERSILGVASK